MKKITQNKGNGKIEEGATVEINFPFFIAPNWIIDIESELTSYEKLTYLILSRYGNQGKIAFPSYNTIGKKGGFSRDTAIRAIKGLIEKGLIIKQNMQDKSGNYASNNYKVIYNLPGVVAHSNQGSSSQQPGVVADSNSINKDYINKEEEAAATPSNILKADQVVNVYIEQLKEKDLVPVHNKGKLIKQYTESPLTAVDVKQVIAKLESWFKTADNYTVGQGYPLGLFIKDFNSIEKPPREKIGICPECGYAIYKGEEHICTHYAVCDKCDTAIRYYGPKRDEEILQQHVCNSENLKYQEDIQPAQAG